MRRWVRAWIVHARGSERACVPHVVRVGSSMHVSGGARTGPLVATWAPDDAPSEAVPPVAAPPGCQCKHASHTSRRGYPGSAPDSQDEAVGASV
eukprot:4370464-Prymnesium_polylepis.1